MWVKVISKRHVPYVGKPGAVRNIGRASAKALIALGKVAPVDDPTVVQVKAAVVEVTKPVVAESLESESAAPVEAEPAKINAKKPGKKTSKKKAAYKRRDMVPERNKSAERNG